MFPLDALQITPNVVFIVQWMQFSPRLVALPQRRWYWSWMVKNVYQCYLWIGSVCFA